MICDVLSAYRERLAGTLRPETARIYTNRLESLLEGQSITEPIQNLDVNLVLKKLSDIKYKNEFSQYKNAFLYFAEFYNIALDNTFKKQLEELEKQTHKKYRKSHKADFEKINGTINHLKNKKLKLCYQTLLESGLRVSELVHITKKDVKVENNAITFHFIGKGGNNETVILSKKDNPKLYDDLLQHINNTKDDTKLFYSTNYLQAKAKKYDFQCHDLRRACSKIEYKKTKSKKEVQKKLRHRDKKTTNIYLKSKIKI